VRELNEMIDREAIFVLQSLEEPPILKQMGNKQLDIRIHLTTIDTTKSFTKVALIDLGCTSSCISRNFIQENGINTQKLPFPITCYNADGTINKSESITDVVDMNMMIGDHIERIQFSVTNLGKRDMFLGYEWLQQHNPSIDWQSSNLYLDKCRHWCRRVSIEKEPKDIGEKTNEVEERGRILFVNMEEKVLRWNEIEMRRVEETSGEEKFEDVVPEEYWEFKEEVFDKKTFDKLPPRRP